MNKEKLFVTSCLSIATAAMVFAIRGDVAGPMSAAFQITNEQMGLIFSPAFWAFTIAIFISGNLVDVIGMRTLHMLSAIGFIAGVLMIVFAPRPDAPIASLLDHPGTMMLYAGFFLFGLSHGLVEGVINPLIATIYSSEKTKRIIVYCSSSECDASPSVAKRLIERGFNQVIHYEGGMNDWKDAHNPIAGKNQYLDNE